MQKWPLAATFLLLCPMTMAQAPGLAASSVAAHGTTTWMGTVTGAYIDDVTTPCQLAGEVSLIVESAVMELDTQRIDVYAGGAGVTPTNTSRTETQLRHARIAGFAPHATCRILVASPGAEIPVFGRPDSVRLAPAAGPNRPFQAMASGQRPATSVSGPGLGVSSPAMEAWNLTAPFTVVVWGANFTIADQNGQRVIWTGQQTSPVQGGAVPPEVASQYVAQEAYIHVAKGALQFQANSGFTLLASQLQGHMDSGSLNLHNPSGTLPLNGQPLPSGSKHLELQAPLTANFQLADAAIAVSLPEPPNYANLDGKIVAAPTSNTLLAALSLLAMVLVPTSATIYSRIQLRRRIRALDHLVTTRCFDRALLLARRIRRFRPRQQEALVAETLSLIHGRDFDAATAVLEEEGWSVGLSPMRDYLRANAASGRGRMAEARRWLERSIKDAPEFAAEAKANPLLSDLVRGGPHAASRTS